jgi:hypothetical protein
VYYNPAKIPLEVPLGVEDKFLFGIIQGEGGTCATLPVLYVAVGRRLRYPLKLVGARCTNGWGHGFIRWDEPGGERFNVEINNEGFDCPEDDHYRREPYLSKPPWEESGTVLKSKSAREELASFLIERAGCWRDEEDKRREAECTAWAWGLAPTNCVYAHFRKRTMHEWIQRIDGVRPPHFPEMFLHDWQRQLPPHIPREIETDMHFLRMEQYLFNDPELERQWWEPMRKGLPMRERLVRIDARCAPGGGYTITFKKALSGC